MTMNQIRNMARINQGVRNMSAIRRYGGPIDPQSARKHERRNARNTHRELLMLSTAVKNATRKHRGVPKGSKSKRRRSASARLMRDSGWVPPRRLQTGTRIVNFPPQRYNDSVRTENNLGNRSRIALLMSNPRVASEINKFI